MKHLLKQKYKKLVEFKFILSADYSEIVDNFSNNKSYILSDDFITQKSIEQLKKFFLEYHQIEFYLFTEFGYDYWNLENVNVLQYNNSLYNSLKELITIKEFCFNYKIKKTKDFSVFIGSTCRERLDFFTAIGIIGKLKNANYSLFDQNITLYKSDSSKYEFLFGENFENYQANLKPRLYKSTDKFWKYNHKENFPNIKNLILESFFYIGLENQPVTGKDNISEKSLYGYITGTPTFNVIGPHSRTMLKDLGFKSMPLFEIEKNYNKNTLDETLFEYMKDILFLCNLTPEQWDQFYNINYETLYHNYNNVDVAFNIINKNIHTVLDS